MDSTSGPRRLHRPLPLVGVRTNVIPLVGWIQIVVGLIVVVTVSVLSGAAVSMVGSIVMTTSAWVSWGRMKARRRAAA